MQTCRRNVNVNVSWTFHDWLTLLWQQSPPPNISCNCGSDLHNDQEEFSTIPLYKKPLSSAIFLWFLVWIALLPKHLNQDEVRTLTCPLQKACFFFLLSFCYRFTLVLWVVVLLHHPTSNLIARQMALHSPDELGNSFSRWWLQAAQALRQQSRPKPGWSSFAGYTLLRRAAVSSIYKHQALKYFCNPFQHYQDHLTKMHKQKSAIGTSKILPHISITTKTGEHFFIHHVY